MSTIVNYDIMSDELTDEEFDDLAESVYIIRKSEALKRKRLANQEPIPWWGKQLKKTVDTLLDFLERNPGLIKKQGKNKPKLVRDGIMSQEAYNLFFSGE